MGMKERTNTMPMTRKRVAILHLHAFLNCSPAAGAVSMMQVNQSEGEKMASRGPDYVRADIICGRGVVIENCELRIVNCELCLYLAASRSPSSIPPQPPR